MALCRKYERACRFRPNTILGYDSNVPWSPEPGRRDPSHHRSADGLMIITCDAALHTFMVAGIDDMHRAGRKAATP